MNKLPYQVLKRYVSGTATSEEERQVEEWLEKPERPFRQEHILHALWNETQPDVPSSTESRNHTLGRIHHRINLRQSEAAKASRTFHPALGRKESLQILRTLGRIAAVLLIGLLAFNGYEWRAQRVWERNQDELVYHEIHCPLGATSQFVLPDGTKGKLNNGSTLRYPATFRGDAREVELLGEAFFDVVPDKQHPFLINTSGLDVRVLGTRVNVYSYPEEDYQEITLESGAAELVKEAEDGPRTLAAMKPGQHVLYRFGSEAHRKIPRNLEEKELIQLSDQDDMAHVLPGMKPGQLAHLQEGDGDLYLQYTETEAYTGWTDGKLILRNDPMPVLLKRMERWYSVSFRILDDRINEYTFWATFGEENLDQVLKLLSLTGPLSFTKQERKMGPDGVYLPQVIDVRIK
ncbi:MAG: DUF4974 domain-containing protein [Bacteroidales bacterium]